MYRELNEKEHKWFDKLFEAVFKDKDILKRQILKSKVLYEQGYAFLSLKFSVENGIEKYPYHVRVPIEMRAYQKGSAPIVFLLHVINGIVNELEIISADSSEIKADNIRLEDVEYEINKEVL